MSNAEFIAARVLPLTWAKLSQMGAHGRREIGAAHCDPTRRHLIRYGTDVAGQDGRDPLACARALVASAGAFQRPNTSRVAAEVLIIASPSWFGDPLRPAPDRLAEFEQRAVVFARERWPGQVAAWRVDLDEATPTVSVFVCPIAERTTRSGTARRELSYREAFGHPRKLAQLQTDLAAAFAGLGLSRGRPKSETGAVHRPPALMRSELARNLADAERARAAARVMVGELVLKERAVDELRRRAEANGAAARADRTEAARLLADARKLLDFAGVVAAQARALLPTLAGNVLHSAEALVAQVSRGFHLVTTLPTRTRDRNEPR